MLIANETCLIKIYFMWSSLCADAPQSVLIANIRVA